LIGTGAAYCFLDWLSSVSLLGFLFDFTFVSLICAVLGLIFFDFLTLLGSLCGLVFFWCLFLFVDRCGGTVCFLPSFYMLCLSSEGPGLFGALLVLSFAYSGHFD